MTGAGQISHTGSWEREMDLQYPPGGRTKSVCPNLTPDDLSQPTMDLLDRRTPDHRPAACADLDQATKAQQICPTPSTTGSCPNGEERHYRNVAQIDRDDYGRPVRAAGFHPGHHAGKSAVPTNCSGGMRCSHHHRNIPGGVSLADKDLNYVAFNRQFGILLDILEELLAHTPLPMLELVLFNARRGEYGPAIRKKIADHHRRARPVPCRTFFERTRPNGSCSKPRNATCRGWLRPHLHHDITDRNRTETPAARRKVFDNNPGDHDHRPGQPDRLDQRGVHRNYRLHCRRSDR